MTKTKKRSKKIDLTSLVNQVEHYLNATLESRMLAERDRDYKDGFQFTSEQLEVLKRRKQAPIVNNRIKPKIEGLKGLLDIRNTEIKAFPRNQGADEKAAHALTDALRYIDDNNNIKDVESEVFDNLIVEGNAAGIVEVEQNAKGEAVVKVNHIEWDRFYYDPHSRRKDFADAKFKGQILWLDEEEVEEMFPNADVAGLEQRDLQTDETHSDKPMWAIKQDDRIRIRVAQHYFIKKGVWHVAMFTGSQFLMEPQESPYLDEDGKPCCPIEGVVAYRDRNNNCYGEVRAMIDPQNEINHRRSKALHLLSSRQTMSADGAVSDVAKMKAEMAKPDGHIQINGDSKNFEIIPTSDFTQGQFSLYQDAKAELDASSFNAQLAGERQSGDLSGKAIDKLQSAGSMEINGLFRAMNSWKKRMAIQKTARIKQYWNEEKWIRITEDQDSLRWVGLNTQITLEKYLEEQINDEANPLELRLGATATYQAMIQGQDPRLKAVIEIQNDTKELDVDIILEESYDVVNMQQEQFQILAQFAQSSKDIDIIELIHLSNIKNKDQLVDKIEKRRAQAAQANGNLQQMQAQEQQVKNAKLYADAQLTTKKAEQAAIENQLMINNPDGSPQVNV